MGGHCGINYFKVEGPAGANLDGAGGNIVQTDLFSVQGKLYQESSTPPSIAPLRATYFRSSTTTSTGAVSTTGRVNLWVEAPASAQVVVSGLPQTNQNGPMTGDGAGNFYKRAVLNSTAAPQLPVEVTYQATNSSGTGTTQRKVQLLDRVEVTGATYAPGTKTLTVTAESSDRINTSARPTLTLKFGAYSRAMRLVSPGRYSLSLSPSSHPDAPLTIPPAHVSVTSSRGGSDSENVAD